MKKNTLISIIIPTYNSIKFIKKTIKSILNQTHKDFEIIFVDDCSNDGTYKYLVATNAIGMGLNLHIKRIIFHSMRR